MGQVLSDLEYSAHTRSIVIGSIVNHTSFFFPSQRTGTQTVAQVIDMGTDHDRLARVPSAL